MYKLLPFIFTFLCPTIILAQKITITVLYDNVSYAKNLTTARGFACLVEGAGKNILFDSGGNGEILLSNFNKLNLDPKKVDIVVLSHIHGDHVGGILDFLQVNNNVIVYVPDSFPASFKDKINNTGAKVISVQTPMQIYKNIYSTGELGDWPKEQSLVLDTKKGLVLITGCAHPGIVNIVKHAKKIWGQNSCKQVFLILGGFHLNAYSETQVQQVISELKTLGVEKVAPSHCTGGTAIALFKQAWQQNFYVSGCGAKIII